MDIYIYTHTGRKITNYTLQKSGAIILLESAFSFLLPGRPYLYLFSLAQRRRNHGHNTISTSFICTSTRCRGFLRLWLFPGIASAITIGIFRPIPCHKQKITITSLTIFTHNTILFNSRNLHTLNRDTFHCSAHRVT